MFNSNGFVVTRKEILLNEIKYFGVDTGVWPIEDASLVFFDGDLAEFERETEEFWRGENNACLASYKLAKKYSKHCEKEQREHRVLYIETTSEEASFHPSLHDSFAKKDNFLGYDVGYNAGDFYSAIYNDIIWRPQLFKEEYCDKLNEFGLFYSARDAENFIQYRQSEKEKTEGLFEEGKMNVMAIYSCSDID